ncbi:hypothetical protein [Brevibacillus sp. SYSU BS000544]|uniref:hypothetical protein n=1 Tax=Brevibacillus sp. SYSU BS000544 TaxID=3416443 RepID=UPI003CE564AD
MERMDEKIIHMMNELEDNTHSSDDRRNTQPQRFGQNLQQAFIVIGDEHIPLEERSILSEKIKIRMPKSFKVMSQEMASFKYPSERRPGLIYTDTSASINIAFNHIPTSLVESEMKKFTDAMVQIVKKTQPAAQWIGEGIRETNGHQIGYCECITPALDTDVYQLMFFISLEGKALLCTFNCTIDQMEDWQPIARGVLESVEIVEQCDHVKGGSLQ